MSQDLYTLDKAGQYNLTELKIISYQESNNPRQDKFKSLDILPILRTFELTENLFAYSLAGRIIVEDNNDFRTTLPITGLERLSLSFNTPGLLGYDYTEDTGVPFRRFKIANITLDPTNPKKQYYEILFCSPESYENVTESVSEAFTGPVENGVQKVLRNKKYLNSKKRFFFEPTKTNAKYVIPSKKPYETISFLARQAISAKYNNSGYMFYETADGYHFRSLESLFSFGGGRLRKSKWNYQTQMVQTTDMDNDMLQNTERRMMSIKSYDFESPMATLENMQKGMYANKLVVHDAFNKTITEHNFDYHSNFEKEYHAEPIGTGSSAFSMTPIAPFSKESENAKAITDLPNSKRMVMTDTTKIHNDYEFVPVSATLPKQLSKSQVLRQNVLNMSVYGKTDLRVGDMINISLPLLRPTNPDEEDIANPYFAGRYVVLAIKHIVAVETGSHDMIIKCMKDSVGTPLPTSGESISDIGKDLTGDYSIYDLDESINTSEFDPT